MKPEIEEILKEIFDPFILGDEFKSHKLSKSPSLLEIEELASLMLIDESEESFQKFLSKHSHFLFRQAFSTDESPLGIIAKPPISNFNFADFAIFSVSQGGCHIQLIEIERPSDKLFTKKLTPANKLQTAIGQVYDWKEWLQSNQQTFVNSAFRILKDSPKYPSKSEKGTFIYGAKNRLDSIWQAFGGNESCTFDYLIILGRWSKLTEKEKKRLILLNNSYSSQWIKIRTYDNFIRKAIDGPKNLW
jgi:Domain of unknown function (DUF4263)